MIPSLLLLAVTSLPSIDPRALFARERAAVGGAAWARVAAVRTSGVAIQGGAPNPFTQIVDRATGWSKTTAVVGALTDVSGYDGIAWDDQGSAVTFQTLPGLQADNVTQAYVARDGWWNPRDPARMQPLAAAGGDPGVRVTPAGGSAVDVWFNPASGLIDRLVAHGDGGDVETRLDDYRAVGDVVVAFRSDTHDAAGAETVVVVRAAAALPAVPPGALARPQPRSLGRIVGGTVAVVPFATFFNDGWVFTELRVGGKTARVLFDSGAVNYFTLGGARRLGLRGGGGLSVEGVGSGSVGASIADLGTIGLGNALLDRQHGIVAPLPYRIEHPLAGHVVDGLIGAEFLQNLRIRFDFDAQRMTLTSFAVPSSREPGATVEPLLSDGQGAYVRATVDGVPGWFLLDTGDHGGITLFRRFATAHGLFRTPGVAYLDPGGVGGNLPVSRYRAASFGLGGAVIRDAIVDVSDATGGSFASRTIAGNIGLRILQRYRVTFDVRAGTVSFVPGAHVAAPFSIDRSGLSLGQREPSSFVVLSVVPGSPAAGAGVRAGDRIVAFNGASVERNRYGIMDADRLTWGARTYTLTTLATDGTRRTVTIHPRELVPATP